MAMLSLRQPRMLFTFTASRSTCLPGFPCGTSRASCHPNSPACSDQPEQQPCPPAYQLASHFGEASPPTLARILPVWSTGNSVRLYQSQKAQHPPPSLSLFTAPVPSSHRGVMLVRHNLPLGNALWLFQITLLTFACLEIVLKRIWSTTIPRSAVRTSSPLFIFRR